MSRVLLLEDHDDVRAALSFIFRSEDYEVIAAASVEMLPAEAAATCPDAAVLDVRMPGRSGDDYAQELAANCPGIPIVFITGESEIDRLKTLSPHCDVMQKPIDIDVLLKLLARALAARR